MRQSSEDRVKHLMDTSSGGAIVSSAFNFRQTLSHRRLDPGRYLILMRQYHGKGRWRRPAGLVSTGGREGLHQ
jgi:hypothetical protein